MPASAWSARLRPSKANGLVTTATVRMPSSLATDATIGAEPVPVPPPRPAVTNTMSAPSSTFLISSRSSSAAFLPTSGSEPAPRPPVSRLPSWSFTGAGDERRACKSVFPTMKSTPVNEAAIMRLTALEPPPPRPITLIFAASRSSSSSNTGRRPCVCSIGSSLTRVRVRECRCRADGRFRKSSACPAVPDAFRAPVLLEELRKPVPHATTRALHQRAVGHVHCRSAAVAACAVERQAHGGGVDRALHHVGQTRKSGGRAAPHGSVEDLLGQIGHAVHDAGAPGHDHAGRRHVGEPGAGQVARDESEDLFDAGLDDLGEDLPGQLTRLAPAHGGNVDDLVLAHQRGEGAAMTFLQLLGIRRR